MRVNIYKDKSRSEREYTVQRNVSLDSLTENGSPPLSRAGLDSWILQCVHPWFSTNENGHGNVHSSWMCYLSIHVLIPHFNANCFSSLWQDSLRTPCKTVLSRLGRNVPAGYFPTDNGPLHNIDIFHWEKLTWQLHGCLQVSLVLLKASQACSWGAMEAERPTSAARDGKLDVLHVQQPGWKAQSVSSFCLQSVTLAKAVPGEQPAIWNILFLVFSENPFPQKKKFLILNFSLIWDIIFQREVLVGEEFHFPASRS